MNEIYGIKEQLITKGMSSQEAGKIAERITNKFWNHYFVKYNMYKVRTGVSEFIRELRQYGYEIHFVSMRGRNTHENDVGINRFMRTRIVPFLTKLMLRKNGIPYDRLVLVQNEEQKLEYIKFYYPEIVFEDQTSILNAIYDYDKKIHRVCISGKQNEDKILSGDALRISDYREDREKLDELIDKRVLLRNSITLKNRFINIFQIVIKGIGQWYFLIKYKPIIYGSDNIPSRGSIVYVGNHRDKLDPVFVTISAKRSIHWAALLRMFQGKEDLFCLDSGKWRRKFSAKFITAMGALPIARPTDIDYQMVNMETINELEDILNRNGAVGFFPEGTINRNPEEKNILTLKSNRVFRMAVETDSYVQPFSIVWIPEKLKMKNKLIIIYAKPINTHNRNKKDVRDLWFDVVNDGIEYSKKLMQK